MDVESKESSGNGGEWKSLIQSFVSSILAKMSDNISDRIKNWFRHIVKRVMGLTLFLLGLVFLMIGVVLFCNTIWVSQSPWIGYVAVGSTSAAVGYLMNRK